MYPSWERISEIILVWHTTMAYRISFLYPLSTGEEKRDERMGKGERKKRRREIISRKHQLRIGEFPRLVDVIFHCFGRFVQWARTGVNETVNYHPLNNGAVYEFRHHVAPARSLRPTEALGTATSLLNFRPSITRNERETRRGELRASRSSLN